MPTDLAWHKEKGNQAVQKFKRAKIVSYESLIGIILLQNQQTLTGILVREENQYQEEGQPANLSSVSEMFLGWLRLPKISNFTHKELLGRNSQNHHLEQKQNTVIKRFQTQGTNKQGFQFHHLEARRSGEIYSLSMSHICVCKKNYFAGMEKLKMTYTEVLVHNTYQKLASQILAFLIIKWLSKCSWKTDKRM